MRKYVVAATRRLTPTVVLLTLRPKRRRDRIKFAAGQYAALGFKRNGRPSPMRCFSIVSAPNNLDELQFAMRIQGNFTQRLSELRPGSEMFVRGPFGTFVVDEQFDRNIVLLAGGIGITPFMSILRDHAQRQAAQPVTLLYSCSSQDDMPFYDELRELEQRDPRLRVVYFITNGPADKLDGARVITVRIGAEHVARLTAGQYNAHTFFLCGPARFTSGLREALLAAGAEPERIVSEDFTPAKANQTLAAHQGWDVRRWTYGLTGAGLLAATMFIASLDLARAVPRLAAAAPAVAQTKQAQAVKPAAASASSAVTASSGTGAAAPSSAPAPQASYQPPVTSVS